ncbi:alpha/beta hydrolase family protein [Paraflavitalea pollutisoli]|uniref:alpha/beta hydrolase family protein n=1 Tax=Paraflavitalea pollutisoli TaxID=3034143 RepID=UPI0023ECED04|nr:alpha/beta hydrolase [Paraflavitalea sp. H1-2-19X]
MTPQTIVLSIGLLLLLQLTFAHTAAATPSMQDTTHYLHEEKYVTINGSEQWITIKGNPTKPAILFFHGGPGSPITPYADNVYKTWEKDFVLIQWDQRGTARTFGKVAPAELTLEYLHDHPLTLSQMTADGIAVAEYAIKQLKKDKLILAGTSWGSLLGVQVATARPDLFYAYIGHSQIVQPDNDSLLFNKVYKIAKGRDDRDALDKLKMLGRPPYERARNVGQLYRILKKYEAARSTPPPAGWFVETQEYSNEQDERNREMGDDYSFVHFIGDKPLGVSAMRTGIDLLRDNTVFKIPVYLIQGEHDILTSKETTRRYFDKLQVPAKKYVLLPNAAHGFNQSVVTAQFVIARSIKVK